MTNGGANAVTMRNTERARADRPGIDGATTHTLIQSFSPIRYTRISLSTV